MDSIFKNDVQNAFSGKMWTYTAAINNGIILGIAVANEAGYTPINPFHCDRNRLETYKQAQLYADELNSQRGQSKMESLKIVASSMAQGKVNAGA